MGRRGAGRGQGSGLNGGRADRSMPHPPVGRPRGEKPLGGGGAFKTKKCCVKPRGRGREEGGGGAAQAACFPSTPAERTSPTLGRWLRREEKGGGLSSATVSHFTFHGPRWRRGAAVPQNCSAPSSEPRVRSGPGDEPREPSRSSACLDTHSAPMLPRSRWTRVRSRQRRAAPPRPRTHSALWAKKSGRPGSARSPQPPSAATCCRPKGRAAPVRAHTRAEDRANSRSRDGCRSQPPCGGQRPPALQSLRRGWDLESLALGTRAALPAALAAPDRRVLLQQDSRTSEQHWETVPGRQRRRRNESPSEPGTLRTLFFALCRAWLDLSQAAGLMTTLDTLTSCSTFCFYCKHC